MTQAPKPEPEHTPASPEDEFRHRIDGRATFLQTFVELLQEAAEGRWPNICLCAPHFLDWPLGDVAVVDALTQWARRGGQRHLDVLAANYEHWPQHHPRWLRWYQTWAHLVTCWQASEDLADPLPSILLLHRQQETVSLQLTNSHYQTGWLNRGGPRAALAHREIDVILQRSTPGFSASTLGL